MNFIIFVFCFLNLYGPLSTNITLVFNVLLFILVGRSRIIVEKYYLIFPITLVILSIAALFFSRDPFKDYSVIGVYARMLVNCVTFPSIISYFYAKKTNFLDIIILSLLLHCIMVLIQMPFPELQDINGLLFRFERDQEILADLTLRRLGLAGGFDQSALFAIVSTVLSIELYYLTYKRKYVVFTLISFISSLFTSRTGMVGAVSVILVCMLLNGNGKKHTVRMAPIFIASILTLAIIYFILPIILRDNGYDSSFTTSYGENTSTYLFGIQLSPLEYLNIREWIMGYGCGVRKAMWLYGSSDIGYVKQIYQVGITGILLMLYFCFLMAKMTYKRYKKIKDNRIMKIGNQLMWIVIILFFVLNYKNHLLYNICSFEIVVIVYLYLYCYYTFNGVPRLFNSRITPTKP